MPQQLQISTILTPFSLSPANNVFKLQFIRPSELPMTLLSCKAVEDAQNLPLLCSLLLPVSGNTINMEI